MEDTADRLHEINDEVAASKRILQELSNEVAVIHSVISPALSKHVTDLRSSRMAVVQEVQSSLRELRELRKFFLESDYEKEMERLERFVRLCREIQSLKQSGVFDAVCDSAIRMAVKEEQ